LVEFTGERLVPGQVDQDLLNEHLARYAFASRLARNKRVLDIACGMGYGSAELAKVAERVVGLDVSDEAVNAAREAYPLANLQFISAPAQAIPFDDGSFDLVVAFEVIEHLEDWPALLKQAQRLLAPGGQFIISTPNKEYYAESRRLAGPNPYHVHEFTYDEFRGELEKIFPSVSLFLQNHVGAISFQPGSGSPTVTAELAGGHNAPQPAESHFFLAVCALSPQTGTPFYVYLPSSANVLREREHHIAKLEGELQQKDAWLDQLKTEHARLHELHEKQVEEARKSSAWALSLEQELESARARVVALQKEIEDEQKAAAQVVAAYETKIAELETELAARTERVLEVQREYEAELQAKSAELAKCIDLLHAAERLVEERTEWALRLDERIKQLEHTLDAAQGSRWVRLGRTFGVGPNLQKY